MIGATYSKRGKRSFLVTVHSHGQRQYKMVRSEADAKALVAYIHKQELAGVNVVEAIRKARAAVAPAPTYPKLKEAVSEWIESQIQANEFRASTGSFYRKRLRTWVYPHALPDGRLLGDLPVNQVTREILGGIVQKMRGVGRSQALIAGVRTHAAQGLLPVPHRDQGVAWSQPGRRPQVLRR